MAPVRFSKATGRWRASSGGLRGTFRDVALPQFASIPLPCGMLHTLRRRIALRCIALVCIARKYIALRCIALQKIASNDIT